MSEFNQEIIISTLAILVVTIILILAGKSLNINRELLIFSTTLIGFILAGIAGKRLGKRERERENKNKEKS